MFRFKVCLAGRITTFSFRVEDDYRLVKPLVDLQAPDLNLFRIRSATVCTIDDGINKVYGVALQSRLDTFDAKIGREIALARALKAKGYEKGCRRLVWWVYQRAVEKERRRIEKADRRLPRLWFTTTIPCRASFFYHLFMGRRRLGHENDLSKEPSQA